MKVVVTGTRGIPNIMGGVETHCEELFPRISAAGHDVTVIRRSCYVGDDNHISSYKGVALKDIYAPRKKSLEVIVHTFLAVLSARRMHADILHIHAIGPSLMTLFARLLGLKVVTTHHGPDYDRQKWGVFAKFMLKAGERMGAMFSNEVIVISHVIEDILHRKYGRDSNLIFNGVTTPEKSSASDMSKNFKLVIAGDADHEDEYSQMLKKKAKDSGVVLTGFIRGERLNQILTNAALFVLPSYHEGLPISLLEAMSYNIDVVVSDIPANKLPELDSADFFRCGEMDSLTKVLNQKEKNLVQERVYDLTNYDWNHIAEQTIAVYKKAMRK